MYSGTYLDTAISAKRVLEDGNLSQAAIAGTHAAELYGLHIIEHDIANQQENYTRFVVVLRVMPLAIHNFLQKHLL